MLKLKLSKSVLLSILLGHSLNVAYADQPIICEIDAQVIPSQQFQRPTQQYTRLKNDGAPMLLIGINIQTAIAVEPSKSLKEAKRYCTSLIGQQKDVHLSGQYDQISIQNGDQIKLKHVHQSAKRWPYWPDFYYWIKPTNK